MSTGIELTKEKEELAARQWISGFAHYLWIAEGCPVGREKEHWAQAEAAYQCQKTRREQKEEKKQEMSVHIRWSIRRDMPEILTIETESFEFLWLEEDFIRCLRQRNCIGMVAENVTGNTQYAKDKVCGENSADKSYGEPIVGFMIYELNKARTQVLNFAVALGYRRQKIGAQMMAKLISKLSAGRRTRITLEVRESNLAAQLFFRANGFRAVSVLRNFYEDTPEDAYVMQYRFGQETAICFHGVNRISQLVR